VPNLDRSKLIHSKLHHFMANWFLAGQFLAGMALIPRKNKTWAIPRAIIARFAASWSHRSGSAPLFVAPAQKSGQKILGLVIPGCAPSCLEKWFS
jgi:hypothetical protein